MTEQEKRKYEKELKSNMLDVWDRLLDSIYTNCKNTAKGFDTNSISLIYLKTVIDVTKRTIRKGAK